MRKRNHAVYIRMTTDEFEKLQSKVKQSGLSMQAYIIHAALEGKVSTIEEINILRERSNHLEDIDRQLRGIGTNVNQLAYVANGQGVIPSAIKLAEISHEVTSFRNEVRKNWQLTRQSIHQQRVMEP
ncbi:plasmid mobilization protein [Pseudobutyrivibrio ruminis]|uniref:plasmid mobilization protein n=1 Tax=Pseudobutyrivibrio ruminis TaxID=46206 RepID=UPI00051AC88D|nr:plasmid mobilization relaxosome protein MobC [Pseudobutyrivibrio ruminis]